MTNWWSKWPRWPELQRVYFFLNEEKNFKKNPKKNYKILKIPKTIFFIKISFEIMSAF